MVIGYDQKIMLVLDSVLRIVCDLWMVLRGVRRRNAVGSRGMRCGANGLRLDLGEAPSRTKSNGDAMKSETGRSANYRAQVKWQRKQRENGRCINCTKPAALSRRGGLGQYCESHRAQNREYMREYFRRKARARTDALADMGIDERLLEALETNKS